MKNILKIFFVFIFLALLWQYAEINVYANGVTWFRHYGGTQGDEGWSIQQASDGGYIVAGQTVSYTYGGTDFAIYKLDSSGNKVWFKHYGGTNDDSAYSIQQTSDGGYIVTGVTESYTLGSEDIAIYKLDSNGNKAWFKHYGGTQPDWGYSIQQTSAGDYIVAGRTESFTNGNYDFAIYKLDSSGNKVWFKHYGGSSNDGSRSIQQTSDGGYVVAGYTYSYSYGSRDFAIYKLDSNGNKTWFKHYGGINEDLAFSIQQTSDGGYIVAGATDSYTHGLNDFAIYKLNSSGNKVWFKHYGGTNGDSAHPIQQTSDGGYIVSGNMNSYTHGQSDFGIYKLNSSGSKVWFKHYGGTNYDDSKSIQQTSDGGYIVAGYTESFTHGLLDFAIYKLDSNGNK